MLFRPSASAASSPAQNSVYESDVIAGLEVRLVKSCNARFVEPAVPFWSRVASFAWMSSGELAVAAMPVDNLQRGTRSAAFSGGIGGDRGHRGHTSSYPARVAYIPSGAVKEQRREIVQAAPFPAFSKPLRTICGAPQLRVRPEIRFRSSANTARNPAANSVSVPGSGVVRMSQVTLSLSLSMSNVPVLVSPSPSPIPKSIYSL